MGWIKNLFDTRLITANTAEFYKQLMDHAIANKLEVHFDYPKKDRSNPSRRVIPGGFTPEGLLRGWCLDDKKWKNWRLDRILSPNGMQPRTEEPGPDEDDEGGEQGSFTPGPARPQTMEFTPKKVTVQPIGETSPGETPESYRLREEEKEIEPNWDEPNTAAFKNAVDSGKQVQFKYKGKSHTVIPRGLHAWKDGKVTAKGYCIEHDAEEQFTPASLDSIGKISPRSQELPPTPEEAERNNLLKSYDDNAQAMKRRLSPGNTTFSSAITPEEYDEAQANDIDPDTFDKASYRRVRNLGATHQQCIEAIRDNKIPIEDYEDAYKATLAHHELKNIKGTSGEVHVGALERGTERIKTYESKVNKVRNSRAPGNGGASLVNSFVPLNEDDHNYLVEQLFGHHMTLKNEPGQHEAPYLEMPGGRRSHEWVMNECAKLVPSLKESVGNTTFYDKNTLLTPGRENRLYLPSDPNAGIYQDVVRSLTDHYMAKGLRVNTVKDHIINKRKMNALANIGSSQFFPQDYRPEMYEE